MHSRALVIAALAVALVTPTLASAGPAPVGSPQDRSVEPVVLTGAQFPVWSAGPDPTVREPQAPGNPGALGGGIEADPLNQSECADQGDHNCYQSSRIPRNPNVGAPVERMVGYRWTGTAFEQIPFQVDERFTRYISNNASDFGAYSGVDRHNTYAFDREGFRFTDNDPSDLCLPFPREDPPGSGERPATMADPVAGLDDDDEVVFMWRDAGAAAPPSTPLPDGIEQAFEITVADPSAPDQVRFAYAMLAADEGPSPSDVTPYVQYMRDAGPNRLGADLFVFSESSYEDYGAAPHGPYCDPATGDVVLVDGQPDIKQRRPLDTAWVRTPRYAFRYEGRWLMTELHVSAHPEGDWTYGPDVIDRWKARAFQQDPSSDTPCCGYEEEDTNWGGSSILMGERAGPVRVIRETWGADSSTNNARREIFYRDLFAWGDSLRVHPIPPLDGIYSQWDYNAGAMTRYYNPAVPDGVAIDGQNDEIVGNLDDPCNAQYDGRTSELDGTYRELYRTAGLCDSFPYHQSIDLTDPTMAGPQALQWEQVAGPHGSVVARTTIRDHTVGGDVQTLLAVPYYRDDSCFDDGTGTDPGPRRRERSSSETQTYRPAGGTEDLARACWSMSNGVPDVNFAAEDDEFGDERYFQGSIGTHGVHLLLVAESDNAYQTVPLTEIVSEQRVVVLPGEQDNVGERYGRFVEFPLSVVARPFA